ncbi:MAG: hypothetical protein JXB47_08810 [Anaerolineae bacterium]|nr:hypothetical protein [Anaerolineae bacterium]
MSSIFSCVMDQVMEVLGQVTEQANQAQEVSDSINSGVSSLIGGGMWAGQSAEAFNEEIMTRLLPEIAALIASIGGFSGNISSALDVIQQGDSEASGAANALGDVFESIY